MVQQLERETYEVLSVNPEYQVVISQESVVVYEPVSYLPRVVRERFGLADSSRVCEVHFPNTIEAPANALTSEHKTGTFRQIFERIALNSGSLFPPWEVMIGVTWRGMALGAKTLGFEIARIDENEIDPGRLEKIRRGYV